MSHEWSYDLANFIAKNYDKQLQLTIRHVKIKKRKSTHKKKESICVQCSLPPNLYQYFLVDFVVWHVQPAKLPQKDLLRSDDKAVIPRQLLR